MIEIKDKKDCSGCYACASACPQQCIEMRPDGEGFLYPEVDETLCSRCGRCVAICPVAIQDGNRRIVPTTELPKAYGAYHQDEKIRAVSSSGGVFTALAEVIVHQGGVVFGAAMTKDCYGVEHIAVTDTEGLARLRGTKYVQSRIGDAYREAKRYLAEDKAVYFSGTPCQINGLYAYLGIDHTTKDAKYPKLITQDNVCYGVPSPLVWKKHVQQLERKRGKKLTSVHFRDKTRGWQKKTLGLRYEDGAEDKIEITRDMFMQGFLRKYILRPSCHQCRFKGLHREADLTLADFWGIDQVMPDMNDGKGVSLLLLHSADAKALWEQVAAQFHVRETDCSVLEKYNDMAVRSAEMPADRGCVMEHLDVENVDALLKKYVDLKPIEKVKRFVRNIID